MIKNLKITNFKNIKEIELRNLKRINFIAGKNGEGKTSILDIIFISNDIMSPDCFLKPIVFRGGKLSLENGDPWKSYFRKMDASKKIELHKDHDKGEKDYIEMTMPLSGEGEVTNSISNGDISTKKVLPMSTVESSSFKARLYHNGKASENLKIEVIQQSNGLQITSKVSRHNGLKNLTPSKYITTSSQINNAATINSISDLIKKKDKEFIIESMRKVNKKITDFEIGLVNNEASIFFDIGEETLSSLDSLGEGAGKLLTILVTSHTTKNGIILIDEIENGIHYSLMPEIIKTIFNKSKENNNQIFITTHSLDIINTINKLYSLDLIMDNDISFTRIGYSYTKDRNIATSFSLPELKISSEESWEIR